MKSGLICKIKADLQNNTFNGIFRSELEKLCNVELSELLNLAKLVRKNRINRGVPTDICSSGYLPHRDALGKEIGCNMSCNFCGYPAKIYDTSDGEFINELTVEAILQDAKKKIQRGATRYKIVSLGCAISGKEFEVAVKAIPKLFELGVSTICTSFGILSKERINTLAEFGKGKIELNHNLEVGSAAAYDKYISESINMWQQRYETLRYAKERGLTVCGGGLVGIGETIDDQIDLVMVLKELEVDSAPFNVFVLLDKDNSVIGNKIRNNEIKRPTSDEIMRILCLWRLGLPNSFIAANSGFSLTGIGDFGMYVNMIERCEINDRKTLPNCGILSRRSY